MWNIVRSVLFAVVIAAPLAADTMGYVEYQLPAPIKGKGWRVIQNNAGVHENVQRKDNLYVPDSVAEKASSEEYFGSTFNSIPAIPHDQSNNIKQVLQAQFSDQHIQIDLLETKPDSMLYEWTATDGHQENAHGWTRTFATPRGTVTLSYLVTGEGKRIQKLRPIWLKALKEAKVTE